MADSGAEQEVPQAPQAQAPLPEWMTRDYTEGPIIGGGVDVNDPKVQEMLRAADVSQFYKKGMNYDRYRREIAPLLKDNPYSQQLRGSRKMHDQAFGGKGGTTRFNAGRGLAGMQDVAPQWLTPQGQRAAQGFRSQVDPQKMNQIGKGLADAWNKKKNLQIASTLATIASMGAGGAMAGATTPALTQMAVQAAIAGAGSAARSGISGQFDPVDMGVSVGGAALPALGGMAGQSLGMNPMITGAITGAAVPAMQGAARGEFDPAQIGAGAVMGGMGGAQRDTGQVNPRTGAPIMGPMIPRWALPIIGAGVNMGANALGGGGSRGRGRPGSGDAEQAIRGLTMMPSRIPPYATMDQSPYDQSPY